MHYFSPSSPSSSSSFQAATKKRLYGRIIYLLAIFGILLTPALVHMSGKLQGPGIENRALATKPALPRTWSETLKFPAAVDSYLNDNFGLRNNLVAWNNQLRYHVLGDINAVQLTAGKDGYIFFNSHAANTPLGMIHFLCGKNVGEKDRAEIVRTATDFMQMAVQVKAESYLLLVPTKPVVYADKLPDWLQQQCAQYTPSLPGIIAALKSLPELKDKIIYPLAEMQAFKKSMAVFPKNTFHWTGSGPQPVAQLVAENYLHHKRLVTLTSNLHDVPSDIQQFLPGVALTVPTHDPDYVKAGIVACLGVACFPEFIETASKIGDVSRYRHRDSRGPKLLLISDSFGQGVAGFFSEYYGEVWHVSLNSINQLSDKEQASFKQILLKEYAPDQILYVFHDAAVSYFDRNGSILLKAGQ
ncbi:hypothetical protein [Undibacterium umbellatum]|uniref:AlgX/AlgJ SGNH hydrolase-like domain-containing protein n=1 Tax=Undibacterium umbellatum TaxID=2762300 RepID=A0ABR6Z5R7_9BURK|nr:hypothetical protein [Undibacterium umbellatum]MBC3907132.1 hypothetical protein [Undibacterium umbellatum]